MCCNVYLIFTRYNVYIKVSFINYESYSFLNLRPLKKTIRFTTVLIVMADKIHHCHHNRSNPLHSITTQPLSQQLHKHLLCKPTPYHLMLCLPFQTHVVMTSLHSLASLSRTLYIVLHQCPDKVLVDMYAH
jgi:hypothetical protein